MLKNLQLGARLGLGFGLMGILILVVGMFSVAKIGKLESGIHLVVDDRMPKVMWANRWIEEVNTIARILRNEVISNDPGFIVKEDARFADSRKKINEALDTLSRSITSEEGKRILSAVTDFIVPVRNMQDEIREFAKQNKDDSAAALLFGEYRELQSQYFQALYNLIKFQENLAKTDGQAAGELAAHARTLVKTMLGVAILLALLLAWLITRSITVPINKCIEVAEAVARGDTSLRIVCDSQDETGKLLESMKTMTDAIQKMTSDVGRLVTAAVEGKLSTRADASKHEGDYRKIVQGINDTLDAVINPLNVTARYVDDISKGIIPPAITDSYNGDFNVIKGNLNNVVKMMNQLLSEIDGVVKAAADGELDKRANAELFQGGWKKLVSGVNDTIVNIVNPLMVTADYVDKVSKGVIPPVISDNYRGQYNIIKNNLNSVVKMMNDLLREVDLLVKSAVGGQLTARADAHLFVGGWKQLVAGVNQTLDAVLQPINEAADVLEKVAARDLQVRVMGNYQGDHAKIKMALNTAVDNLDKALFQVTEGASQVASASEQISAGSQALAQGANEQASSLEEISSSLEEISSMTKQNADNASQAKNLSTEADSNAKMGTDAMNRMSDAIGRIKESSDQTAKIVKTIDEIAMQTNLLALNAAVEAARAGEAGRGFAVVAEEVRNLAQRSAQAAKNTADMIGESVRNADDGVKIAQDVSRSFDVITLSAKKVNELIAEIAAASKEQSQGIEQVTTAVAQMDKVTQQNAANSEEAASSSEELSGQAQELQSMVAQFTLTSGRSANAINLGNVSRKAVAHLSSVSKRTPKLQGHQRFGQEEVVPLDDDSLKEF